MRRYLQTQYILQRKALGRLLSKSNRDYTRFAIVCTGRSGSTWLHTLLNSHPQIVSLGEVLVEKSVSTHDLSSIFTGFPRSIKAVGFKVFYSLEHEAYNTALDKLAQDSEIKIIHLVRENLLAQFVSLQMAKTGRAWSSRKQTGKVHVDRDELTTFQEQHRNERSAIVNRFQYHQVLDVTYEELEKDENAKLQEIQEFLGVQPRKLFSLLKKQSADVSTHVENWEEVKDLAD